MRVPLAELWTKVDIMSTIKTPAATLKYHPDAYRFVDQALRFTQRRLGRTLDSVEQEHAPEFDEERAHISGPELLDGVRLNRSVGGRGRGRYSLGRWRRTKLPADDRLC